MKKPLLGTKNWRQERPMIEANREVYNMHASKFFQNYKVAQTQQLANTNSTSITATEQITRTQLASDSQGMKKSWFVLSSDSLLHIRNATTVHIDHIADMSLPEDGCRAFFHIVTVFAYLL